MIEKRRKRCAKYALKLVSKFKHEIPEILFTWYTMYKIRVEICECDCYWVAIIDGVIFDETYIVKVYNNGNYEITTLKATEVYFKRK